MFLPFNLFSQVIDSDGDGISDAEELKRYNMDASHIDFNPNISDIPRINIWFSGEVEIGVKLLRTSSKDYKNQVVSTFVDEKGEGSREKNYNARSFSNSTSLKIKAGSGNLSTVFTPSLSIDLTNTTNFDISSGVSYNKEKWDSWKQTNTSYKEDLQRSSLTYGPQDG